LRKQVQVKNTPLLLTLALLISLPGHSIENRHLRSVKTQISSRKWQIVVVAVAAVVSTTVEAVAGEEETLVTVVEERLVEIVEATAEVVEEEEEEEVEEEVEDMLNKTTRSSTCQSTVYDDRALANFHAQGLQME
jgi:flavin reductase (DIM6/NTAB) family NADH-FMN oxidoreductase RutF